MSKKPQPIHSAPPQSAALRHRPPIGFTAATIGREHRIAVEDFACEAFTAMVNAGHTFQAALAAVYLSGVSHGLEVLQ